MANQRDVVTTVITNDMGCVVEVRKCADLVRCKDCKYWHNNTEFCGIWSWSFQNVAQRTLSDDYCSRAERREP